MSCAQTDWRALCRELVSAWDCVSDSEDSSGFERLKDSVDDLRAALVQPEPEVAGVTDEELWEMYQGAGTFSPIEFARAAIAADRARWGRPAPAPAGEVSKEEIDCETCEGSGTIDETLGGYGDSNPAATCPDCDGTGVIVVSAPSSVGADGELVAWLAGLAVRAADCRQPKAAGMLTWAAQVVGEHADLVERQVAPVPVAVSERPWEREGWCDKQGQCWMGDPGGDGFIPSWRLCLPEDAPNMRVSLPYNALPLPSGEVEA